MSLHLVYLADDHAKYGTWKKAAGATPIEAWARDVLDAACVEVPIDPVLDRIERLERAILERGTLEADRGLIDRAELAEALGVSSPTVRKWFAAGIIPAEINEGPIVRFDLEDVRAALRKAAAKKSKTRKI